MAVGRHGPVGVVELADHLGRDYTTVSRQVARLDELRLVVRRAGTRDKRVREAEVTELGREMADAIDRMRDYMAQGGEGEALIVLSGGAAALIEPRLNAKVVLVDNLVLEGVLAIARDAHEAMNATHLNPGGTVK